MNNNIYGIDFGTCNFKVFSKASGKFITEKNTIALINKNQGPRLANFMKIIGKERLSEILKVY